MAVNVQIDLLLTLLETSAADFGSPTSRVSYAQSIPYADGTAADQANARWSDQRTLGASGSEEIVLTGLTGALGQTINFTAIKGVLIYVVTGSIVLSRPAANGVGLFAAASDQLASVSNGGFFAWFTKSAAGVAVTAGTGDRIQVQAGISGSLYDIHIIGEV